MSQQIEMNSFSNCWKKNSNSMKVTAKNVVMDKENNIILYQDDNEITRISVRFADEDLWLT